MLSGLNSPYDLYFFTKTPGEFKAGANPYFYEIEKAQQEQALEMAKTTTRSRVLLKSIHFNEPAVEVHDNKYSYIVRSNATREEFRAVMCPESVYDATTVRRGIRGLHYSASDVYGDAIGITIRAETPEEARKQFEAWYATVKQELKALSDRFAIVNKEIEKQIDAAAAKRLDELQRGKKAL